MNREFFNFRTRKERAMVKDYLEFVCGIQQPLSEITVISDYPFGWHAYVLVDTEFAWIIACNNKGLMRVVGMAPCRGIYPGGTLRLAGCHELFWDLQEFFYLDQTLNAYHSPLSCEDDICNSSGQCLFCHKRSTND